VDESAFNRANLYFVFHKAATTIAYLAMLGLTIRFFRGRLDVQFAVGCTLLSAFWCLLIVLKLSHFLQTYYDVFSRLELILPCIFGVCLSIVALFGHSVDVIKFTNGALLLAWGAVYSKWVSNRTKFVKQGHGPIPKGTWVNPPPNVMAPGDVILTSGAVATRLHESVGHAATVVSASGQLYALSSHMDRGCTLEPISDALGEIIGFYILLKSTQHIDQDQSRLLSDLAEEMVQQNIAWKTERNQRWKTFIMGLPLPDHAKQRLLKLYRCTGYDWVGTFMGRVERDRWTCIGAAVELYHRAGIHTNPYGTGLLGFGTTLFDPIMPVRFLNDPAFQLVTEAPVGQISERSPEIFQA
jgi:hypothetical protein